MPNYQGMFLRGYGSQSGHSSDSIGSIQDNAIIRLYGEGGPFTFGGNPGWQEDNGFVYAYGTSYASNSLHHVITDPNKYGSFLLSVDVPVSSGDDGEEDGGGSSTSIEKFYVQMEGQSGCEHATGTCLDGHDIIAWRGVGWDSDNVAPSANEIRLVNVAVKFMIKAK